MQQFAALLVGGPSTFELCLQVFSRSLAEGDTISSAMQQVYKRLADAYLAASLISEEVSRLIFTP